MIKTPYKIQEKGLAFKLILSIFSSIAFIFFCHILIQLQHFEKYC